MQLPRIARCDALSWADYVEAHTIGLPPRLFKALLSILCVKLCALSFKVVTITTELIPFINGYTVISATAHIWAVYQAVNGVTRVFEIIES